MEKPRIVNKFTGFEIARHQVERYKSGKVVCHEINGHRYSKVFLSKGTNFNGLEDKDGNSIHQIPENAFATFLVPFGCVQNHRYDDDKSYISVPENYLFKISIDLGKTGNILESGKNEHNWIYIENVSIGLLKDLVEQNKFISFTISEKQKGADYETSDKSKRTTILIPSSAGDYGGCRITCSQNCIKEIDGKPHLRLVSLHGNGIFAIQKSNIIGQDEITKKNKYGDTIIVAKLKGSEIADLFKKPREQDLEKNINLDSIGNKEITDISDDHEEESGEEMEA